MLEVQELEAGSQRLQLPARRYHRLVYEDLLAGLLVRCRFQRGQEVLRL